MERWWICSVAWGWGEDGSKQTIFLILTLLFFTTSQPHILHKQKQELSHCHIYICIPLPSLRLPLIYVIPPPLSSQSQLSYPFPPHHNHSLNTHPQYKHSHLPKPPLPPIRIRVYGNQEKCSCKIFKLVRKNGFALPVLGSTTTLNRADITWATQTDKPFAPYDGVMCKFDDCCFQCCDERKI